MLQKGLLFILLGWCVAVQVEAQWVQLGQDLDAEAAEDNFGWAVSLNAEGTILAVGGPSNDGNGNQAGHVRVFLWNGQQWVQMGSDLDGMAAGNKFGTSVDLSADGMILAVGVPGNNTPYPSSGRVRVFSWDGQQWVQMGVEVNGMSSGELFGRSVSVSADGFTVAVGAPGSSGLSSGGLVRVFVWNGSEWIQKGDDLLGGQDPAEFGQRVVLSDDGNTLAISEPGYDNAGSFQLGRVRVFQWMGGQWSPKGQSIEGEQANDKLGAHGLALSGDGQTLAVASIENDEQASNAGKIRVFTWDGSSWVAKGAALFGDQAHDQLGRSLALSADGQTLVAGLPGALNGKGKVRTYEWTGSNWAPKGQDIEGEDFPDDAGWSVCLSADGTIVAFGAPENFGTGPYAGHARVFSFTPTSTLEREDQPQIKLYPNPAREWLVVERAQPLRKVVLRVTDPLGRVCLQQNVNELKRLRLSVVEWPSGVYRLELIHENSRVVQSFRVVR